MQKQTKPEPLGASMAKLVLVIVIIVCLGAVAGILGYALTKQKLTVQNPPIAQKADETADWKTYDWTGISFKYPPNWTAEKIYYQTPAQQAQGEHPENIGVELFPGKELKGDDFIAIGGRQVSCEPSEHHAKCYYISSAANYIYTDSNNPEILKVFDLFIKTIEVDEIVYQINNTKYGYITLKNGEYYERPDITKISFGIFTSIEKLAVGDLNNDGKKDAAVVLGSYYEGGSISNYDLNILINENGKLNHLTYGYLGYGVKTNSINIQDGEIVLDMIVVGPGESPCCPTLKKTIKYKLSDNQLLVVADSETADWKTYRNEEYGFEIKYPEDWEVTGSMQIKKPNSGSYLEIIKNNNEIGLTLDDWFKILTIVNGRPTTKAGAQPTFINSVKAYRLDSELEPPNPLFEIVGIADTQRRIFTLYAYSGKLSDNETLDQILSTFKFIEKNIDDNYTLDCTQKPDEFQSKYLWYQNLKQIINKWNLDVVCYNKELNKVVYFKSKTVNDKKELNILSQLGIYDVKINKDNKAFEIILDSYWKCGVINKWSKNGDIDYECVGSYPGAVIRSTYLYNTETKNNELIESCGVGNIDPKYTKACEDK